MDAGAPVPRDSATSAVGSRFIRVRGTTAEWRCQSCDRWQEFGHEWCVKCAQPRRRFGAAATTVEPLAKHVASSPVDADAPATVVPSEPVAIDGHDEGHFETPTLPPPPPPAVEAPASQPAVSKAHEVTPARVRQARSDIPRVALLASMVLPGVGHVALGRPTTGLARMAITAAWVVVAASWINHHAAAAQRAAWAAMVGVAAVWALTALDVVRIRREEHDELLTAGRLCVLVIVVTAALVFLPRIAVAAAWGH